MTTSRPRTLQGALLAAPLLVAVLHSFPTAQGASTPGLEAARQRIERLAAMAGDDPTRQAALVAWEEVVASLAEAERRGREAVELEATRAQAPQRLADIRTELAAPLATPATLPVDTALADAEQVLAQAQARLAAAEAAVAALQEERRRRGTRRLALPGEIGAARQQLEAASGAAEPDDALAPIVAEARRARLEAQRAQARTEVEALEHELASYEARGELLTARQDLAVRRAAEAGAEVESLSRVVAELRRSEAGSAAARALAARRASADLPEPIRELASDNERLARARQALVASADSQRGRLAALDAESAAITSRLASVRKRAEAAGFTQSLALLMRRHQDLLPDLAQLRARQRQLVSSIEDTRIELLELEDQRAALTDLDGVIAERLAELEDEPAFGDERRARAEQVLRELLEARRRLLDELLQEQEAELGRLAETSAAQERRVGAAREYGRYIDEHLLWVRSSRVLGLSDAAGTWRAVRWLLSPVAWSDLAAETVASFGRRPELLAAALGLFALLLLRVPASRRLDAIGERLTRTRPHVFRDTLNAFGLTAFRVLAWPAALWLAAGELEILLSGSDLGRSLTAGLQGLARALVPVGLVHELMRPLGLGRVHFRWSERRLEALRRSAWMLGVIVLPALTVAAILDRHRDAAMLDGLGRLALIVALATLATWLGRALAADDGERGPGRRALRAVAVAVPVALALAAAVGYVYAAHELSKRLIDSITLLLAAQVVHALGLRWLVLERRRLRLVEARAQAAGGAVEPAVTESGVTVESEELDLDQVDAQGRRLFTIVVSAVALVAMWLTWADMLPALQATQRVVLWQAEPATPPAASVPLVPDAVKPAAETVAAVPAGAVTLGHMLLAILVTVATVLCARNVPGLLELGLLRRLRLQPGTGYAVMAVTSYAIMIVGIVVAAGLIGITWNRVQWLAAAITVGLGFGLQEIFANFVSGLIILFERPVRVGDIVTVGGVEGRVTRIRIRATTIIDWDRRELLVPNREFITGQLINWTLTDPITRIVLPVGIAYGSDVRQATAELLRVASEHELVLKSPAPSVVFRSFGESSLDLALRFFIASRDHWPRAMHGMHLAVDDAFRAAGIQISFPQRDLHVRSFAPQVRVGRAESASNDATADS